MCNLKKYLYGLKQSPKSLVGEIQSSYFTVWTLKKAILIILSSFVTLRVVVVSFL